MRGPVRRLRVFAAAEAGISAIEFALLLPVLLVITLTGAQVVQYINAMRKVEAIATAVSSMISQATPASTSTTIATVNALDLNFSYDSTLVIFPYIMHDAAAKKVNWRSDITVSYASVAFTKLNDSCTGLADQSACYSAAVVWTSTGTSGDSYRPCSVAQLPADDNAPYSRYTLPRSVFGTGSIIVVDVTFRFVPTFGSGLVSPVTITRSAFVQPRYATQINFDSTANDGIASTCV